MASMMTSIILFAPKDARICSSQFTALTAGAIFGMRQTCNDVLLRSNRRSATRCIGFRVEGRCVFIKISYRSNATGAVGDCLQDVPPSRATCQFQIISKRIGWYANGRPIANDCMQNICANSSAVAGYRVFPTSPTKLMASPMSGNDFTYGIPISSTRAPSRFYMAICPCCWCVVEGQRGVRFEAPTARKGCSNGLQQRRYRHR
jgi:hypothetical protein